jgi:hypothetical protein
MADKSNFVDLVEAATRQRWRRQRLVTYAWKPVEARSLKQENRPRVSNWPPPRLAEWRLALLRPWKDSA